MIRLKKDTEDYLFFSKIAAIIAVLVGVIGILNSVSSYFFFTHLAYGINVNLNVAVGLVLSGIILWLRTKSTKNNKESVAATVFIVIIFIFSILSILDYITPDTRIDEILLQDNDPRTLKPGHMPLLTAICFGLLCVAFFMQQWRSHFMVYQVPLCIIVIIAIFELIGYLFDLSGVINFLFHINTPIHMALLSGIAFIFLSLGFLVLDRYEGLPKIVLSKYVGGLIIRRIIPFIIVGPIVVGLLKILGESLGLFSFEFGTLWLIVGVIVLLGTALLYEANWLNNLDRKRIKDEEFLKSVLENTNNVIFIKNLQGEYQLINRQFELLTNKNKQELIGKTDYELFDSEFARKVVKADYKVAKSQEMIVVEESFPLKDGVHTYLTNKFPILDESKNVYAIGGIAIDITEQKRAEERFKTIIEAAPDGIIIINRTGDIILINKRIEEMFSFKGIELLGHCVELLIPNIFKVIGDKQKGNFFDLITSHSPIEKELTAKRKNNELLPIEVSISLIETTEGKAALATIRDITHRKAIEEKNQLNLKQLKKRHRELNLLNEFGSNMQVCKKIDEAGRLVANYASHLFPDCAGVLYLCDSDVKMLHAVTSFNNPILNETTLKPEDCWAIRIGNLHYVENPKKDIVCAHNMNLGTDSPSFMCVPLFAQGVIMGLFYLEQTKEANQVGDLKNQEILASTFCEQIALGLTNIKLQETLREQSIRDVLTGLYNRRYLEEIFERELIRLKRNPLPLTVIMFDIDHFKDFNDAYGHKAGDVVLQALASLVSEKMRASDIICRYGGEEFIIILPETSIGTGWQRAEQLRRQVTEMRAYYNNSGLKITISLGVASYPEHGTQMIDLIAAADIALYQAKKKGGDTTVIYTR
jgi:diguanylate cyclase (GGDEF)-like protein/PAS domain S-box-containing protein